MMRDRWPPLIVSLLVNQRLIYQCGCACIPHRHGRPPLSIIARRISSRPTSRVNKERFFVSLCGPSRHILSVNQARKGAQHSKRSLLPSVNRPSWRRSITIIDLHFAAPNDMGADYAPGLKLAASKGQSLSQSGIAASSSSTAGIYSI